MASSWFFNHCFHIQFFYISQVNLSTISNDHFLNKDWPYQSHMILYLETLYSAAPNLLVARDWFCRRTGGVCFHTLPGFNMRVDGALFTGGPVLGGHGPVPVHGLGFGGSCHTPFKLSY